MAVLLLPAKRTDYNKLKNTFTLNKSSYINPKNDILPRKILNIEIPVLIYFFSYIKLRGTIFTYSTLRLISCSKYLLILRVIFSIFRTEKSSYTNKEGEKIS
jgi:hypothetical protein